MASLPIGAEGVIALAFFGITEDFIGFGDVFEFGFGTGAFVDIGVILPCEAAIRFANVVGGCGARDTEDLVVVFVLHS